MGQCFNTKLKQDKPRKSEENKKKQSIMATIFSALPESPSNKIPERFSKQEASTTTIKLHGIPENWNQSEDMQASYSSEFKNFQVPVYWQQSQMLTALGASGIGVFSQLPVKAGTVLRKGVLGKNLMRFQCEEDLPRMTNTTKKFLGHYGFGCINELDDEKVWLWVPGCSFNHHGVDNNVVNVETEEGVNLVACRDISKGEELLCDYHSYGKAPSWFKDFCDQYDIIGAYEGMNNFV